MSEAQKATMISGLCRGRWSWNGQTYTASGVLVPPDVMETDEARYEEKLDIAPDSQVLDMKVTLPAEALPAGFTLAPIEGATPADGLPSHPVAAAGAEPVAPDPSDSLKPAEPAPAETQAKPAQTVVGAKKKT